MSIPLSVWSVIDTDGDGFNDDYRITWGNEGTRVMDLENFYTNNPGYGPGGLPVDLGTLVDWTYANYTAVQSAMAF